MVDADQRWIRIINQAGEVRTEEQAGRTERQRIRYSDSLANYLVCVQWRRGRGKRRNDQRWWWNGKQRLSTLSLSSSWSGGGTVAVQNSGFAMDELFFNRPSIDYLSRSLSTKPAYCTSTASLSMQDGWMRSSRRFRTFNWLDGCYRVCLCNVHFITVLDKMQKSVNWGRGEWEMNQSLK